MQHRLKMSQRGAARRNRRPIRLKYRRKEPIRRSRWPDFFASPLAPSLAVFLPGSTETASLLNHWEEGFDDGIQADRYDDA